MKTEIILGRRVHLVRKENSVWEGVQYGRKLHCVIKNATREEDEKVV